MTGNVPCRSFRAVHAHECLSVVSSRWTASPRSSCGLATKPQWTTPSSTSPTATEPRASSTPWTWPVAFWALSAHGKSRACLTKRGGHSSAALDGEQHGDQLGTHRDEHRLSSTWTNEGVMTFCTTGRVAVVTGSSRGIGRATALRFPQMATITNTPSRSTPRPPSSHSARPHAGCVTEAGSCSFLRRLPARARRRKPCTRPARPPVSNSSAFSPTR